MSREDYLEKTKAQLDKWNAYLSGLEAKAREAKADTKIRYEKEISSIRERMHEYQHKAIAMQASNESAWEDLKRGVEDAWNRLQDAVDHARQEFE